MKAKLRIPVKYIILLVCLVLISACVPTTKTVFLTPDIKGTIIDAVSLKSVPNILIAQQYNIDSEPNVIAPPPKTSYTSTQQWHEDIQSEPFSSCNTDAATRVIKQLAIARKVFTHDNSDLTGLAYNQLLLAKDNFYNACKVDSFLKMKLYEKLKLLDEEASIYAIDRTQLF